MWSKALVAGAVLMLLAPQVAAQNAPQGTRVFVRGTVEQLDGQTLTVKSREGAELTIGLAPNFSVSGVAKRSLADIKEGDYVASTSVRGADGKLRAVEVHIFPEALRGTAEGQFPWDLVPEGIMTNATVAGITIAPQGRVLKVTHKGNQSEIIVPNDIPIVTYVPGDASLLKPGATIFVIAQKKPDGTLASARVTAEKDGVKPPM